MPSLTKRRILVNPGRRKRRSNPKRLSLAQRAFFGKGRARTLARKKLRIRNTQGRSIAQIRESAKKASDRRKKLDKYYQGYERAKRARLKREAKSNPSKRKRTYAKRRNAPRIQRRRKRNVGQIIVIKERKANPTRRRKRRTNSGTSKRRVRTNIMAKRRRRTRTRVVHHRRRRRVSNPAVRRRRRTRSYSRRRHSNPVERRRRSYSRRRRMGNPGRRRSYRRNPGVVSGGLIGRVGGTIGGAYLTSVLSSYIPSSFSSGIMGYIATGLVAVLQGKLIGKVSGKSSLGQDFTTGGFVYLAIKVLKDFAPGFTTGLSGMRGMGLLGGSSFYVPQVNTAGNMGNFIRPAMVPAPYMPPSGMHGIGTRRMGRVR